MANLSQQKRQRMLEFLETIREEHKDDDDVLIALGEIENELNAKKYGLVWEQHEEAVDVQMQDNIPVFTECEDKEITTNVNSAYNFLLEGDNLHSLRLLEKTHTGRIDLIYIDPPYNTQNKEFIYDDKKIDNTDGFQHSKWISFMYERLLIVKNLLSKNGVLAISIGHQEVNNLILLCQEIFTMREVVSITVQTSSGNAVANGFTYTQEYIVFVIPLAFHPNEVDDDKKEYTTPYHGMNLSGFNQTQRPNQVYPIYVNSLGEIIGCGKSLQELINEGSYTGSKEDFKFDYDDCPADSVAIWPVTQRGDACVWRLIPDKLMSIWNKGYIKVVPNKKGQNKYTIQYLSGGIIEQIENGSLTTNKPNDNVPTLEVIDFKTSASSISTIWTDNKYLTAAGSRDIKEVFGKKVNFPFPKPIALIKDIIRRTVDKNAIILDFFAGSGTTAQAAWELNAEDGGTRSVILCTNNEGGICDTITYQRLKIVATGKRVDDSNYSNYVFSNLKYYCTEFVSKNADDVSEALLSHIAEMIQLEHGVKIDGNNYIMVMSDDEADDLERHWDEHQDVKALYISKNVLLTTKQNTLFGGTEIHIIPDDYFKFELQEVGESW